MNSVEICRIPVDDRNIFGILFSRIGDNEEKGDDDVYMIWNHSMNVDLSEDYYTCALLCYNLDINVLLYDYSGYGYSQGGASSKLSRDRFETKQKILQACERSTSHDLACVVKFLEDRKGIITSKQLILMSHHMGSGPVLSWSSKEENKCLGIILQSPLISGRGAINGTHIQCQDFTFPLSSSFLAACDRIYPNLRRISTITSPCFIIHGKEDGIADYKQHALPLYDAVPECSKYEPWLPEKAGSRPLYNDPPQFIEEVMSFITYCILRSSRQKLQDFSKSFIQGTL